MILAEIITEEEWNELETGCFYESDSFSTANIYYFENLMGKQYTEFDEIMGRKGTI